MFTMQGTQATAAGGQTDNVLSGKLYERSPKTGWLRVAMTAEAAGESRSAIFVGGRAVMPESSLSRAARVPLIPDDVIITTPVRAGEQIVITHRNTGAGTNTLFWRIDIR